MPISSQLQVILPEGGSRVYHYLSRVNRSSCLPHTGRNKCFIILALSGAKPCKCSVLFLDVLAIFERYHFSVYYSTCAIQRMTYVVQKEPSSSLFCFRIVLKP